MNTAAQSSQYLSAKEAAKFLGVSSSYFRAVIGPAVASSNFAEPDRRKRIPRWQVADLHAFAAARRSA